MTESHETYLETCKKCTECGEHTGTDADATKCNWCETDFTHTDSYIKCTYPRPRRTPYPHCTCIKCHADMPDHKYIRHVEACTCPSCYLHAIHDATREGATDMDLDFNNDEKYRHLLCRECDEDCLEPDSESDA